ncbi:MAG TPA: TadE/TadG family type IV pilus assembly protein [Micromonosporaceae bacterium]|nr:TadE/TadG family type IV pilus assembly protein [Micromonosporaceae bacterium]
MRRADAPASVRARPCGRRRCDDRGASPIELAILMPVIILALFSSIQVAMYFIARSAALAAAQEAVDVQRLYGAKPGDGQRAAAQLISSGEAGDFLQNPVTIGAPQLSADGTGITVTVTGYAPSLIWVPFRITATAHGTLEVKTPTPTSTVTPAPPGPPTP